MVSGSSIYTVTVEHRRRCRRRSGGRSARTARAGSIRWSSCCRGGFSQGRDGAHLPPGAAGCFPSPRRSASRAVARTTRRCASTSRRCCTASARGWTQQPELLFRLRAVDEKDLVAGIDEALPMAKTGPAAGKVLEADDLSALFGLDMAESGSRRRQPSARSCEAPRSRSKPVRKKAKAGEAPRTPRDEAGLVSRVPPCAVPGSPPAIPHASCNTPRTPARLRAA